MNTADARVHVVDDDLSMREAVSSLLRSMGLQVATYASAAEFLAQCAASGTGLPPRADGDAAECLVLDVRMPGMTGLELQRQLGDGQARLPIVFITAHGDIPMTVRAIKAGAVEFLPKPFQDRELLEAIDAALERSRAARREHAATRELQARYATLTQREREVLAPLLRGLRNKQIAHEMGISEVTVKVHRHHLMEKMQAPSVPALLGMLEQLRGVGVLPGDAAD